MLFNENKIFARKLNVPNITLNKRLQNKFEISQNDFQKLELICSGYKLQAF